MNPLIKKTTIALFATTITLLANVAVADLFENTPEHQPQSKYSKLSCDEMYDLFSTLKKQDIRARSDKRMTGMSSGDKLNQARGVKTKIRTAMKAIRKAAKAKECDFDSYDN